MDPELDDLLKHLKIAEDKNQGFVLQEDIERSELGHNGLFFFC